MYSDILYPTDGSEGAEAALNNVRDLAETYGATVHVLWANTNLPIHGLESDPKEEDGTGMVGDPEGGESGMVGDRTMAEEFRERAQRQGESIVSEVAEQLGGVETRTVVREGEPHEVILDYSDEHDIDLVVMGTHGRTGLERYMIGSVAEKVVRMSDAPVLTVRMGEEA